MPQASRLKNKKKETNIMNLWNEKRIRSNPILEICSRRRRGRRDEYNLEATRSVDVAAVVVVVFRIETRLNMTSLKSSSAIGCNLVIIIYVFSDWFSTTNKNKRLLNLRQHTQQKIVYKFKWFFLNCFTLP